METSELFKKHFGNVPQVNTNHPNIEPFFAELAEICNNEGKKLVYESENTDNLFGQVPL